LQVTFNSYISQMFNTLGQSKVDSIKDELVLLRPKIHELLLDEFVKTYHKPQSEYIKTSFDKLYSTIIMKINSYVKPLINGGYINLHSVDNYKWCK